MRPSRPQMFMDIAHVVAKRATCMRLNVGAVIVYQRRIVSIGYNGSPPGQPHCSGNDCQGRFGCKVTTHAEINALDYLPPSLKNVYGDMDIYITDSPCVECYDEIANDGRIGRIFFGAPYRINDHLINSLWGIQVYRVLPAGYIMNWETKELVDVET